MEALVKNKLEIYNDDPTHVEIVIVDQQPEGAYKYIPESEDEIKLIIYNETQEIYEAIADVADPDFVFVTIDTKNIEAGTYKYDVVVQLHDSGEVYHVARGQEITISRR